MDFAMIGQAVAQTFTFTNMSMIFIGLLIGMIVGCIPGLSVMLGIILMLPLTYTFQDPATPLFCCCLCMSADVRRIYLGYYIEYSWHQLRYCNYL